MIISLIIVITLLLFALAVVTKRRFGPLGLGLAAGALLAESWADGVGGVFDAIGLRSSELPSATLGGMVLIIVPSLLLLISGHTYKRLIPAIIGAAGYAAMALLLMLGVAGAHVPAGGLVATVLHFANSYRTELVALGVALAVLDMFLARSSHHSKH